jgi:hypothetical protein
MLLIPSGNLKGWHNTQFHFFLYPNQRVKDEYNHVHVRTENGLAEELRIKSISIKVADRNTTVGSENKETTDFTFNDPRRVRWPDDEPTRTRYKTALRKAGLLGAD